MARSANRKFDPALFLAEAGPGRQILKLKPNQAIFSQGDPADSIFYLQQGCAKLFVISEKGLEATIALFSSGDFLGEEAMDEAAGVRRTTAKAITACTVLKIDQAAMVRTLHEQHAFSDLFLKFLLARSMRHEADLIGQLFDSSEKRLSRVFMLMAQFGKPKEMPTLPATQETLAAVLGARRSRATYFINRFRKLGWIDFNGRIQIHGSLLDAMLLDNEPQTNGLKLSLADEPRRKKIPAKSRQSARARPSKPNRSLSTEPPAESSEIDQTS
jgi:CRP/FNR family transcriptional regulator, cyclic AMP receptor protein